MGTNRFSALYRFRALFGGDGKKRYIGALLYMAIRGGPGPSQFSEQQKQVRFQQTHNQGLRQLFLTVSWDLRA